MTPAELVTDAMRQLYELEAKDPRDLKYAEWHIHPQTYAELRASISPRDPFSPFEQGWPPNGGQDKLLGFAYHVTPNVEPGRIHLSAETELDATIRHRIAAGQAINVMSPVIVPCPDPPAAPAPTMKALLTHWVKQLRKGARR